MRKIFITCLFISLLQQQGITQTDTLRGDEAREILKQMKMDTAQWLASSASDACKCIDSISLTGKSSNDISADIAKCIDKEVVVYQSLIKTYRAMLDGEKNININVDKKSSGYRGYYFDIETWLMDSCASLTIAVANNNKESATSISSDPVARAAYQDGIDAMRNNNLEMAADFFAKAVEVDRRFAFAWDNLGICYRKLGKYEEAIKAYKTSLRIDPKGVTPLHNIPVAYEYMEKYDKALDAYTDILKVYPDDPEAFYGAGRIYAYFKIDMEKALQNMCKAYNMYTQTSSPYRVDAQKNINYIYGQMKANGKEERFFEILEENNIKAR
jgi:tetratricopeptide (TPR) repeat protein